MKAIQKELAGKKVWLGCPITGPAIEKIVEELGLDMHYRDQIKNGRSAYTSWYDDGTASSWASSTDTTSVGCFYKVQGDEIGYSFFADLQKKYGASSKARKRIEIMEKELAALKKEIINE